MHLNGSVSVIPDTPNPSYHQLNTVPLKLPSNKY